MSEKFVAPRLHNKSRQIRMEHKGTAKIETGRLILPKFAMSDTEALKQT